MSVEGSCSDMQVFQSVLVCTGLIHVGARDVSSVECRVEHALLVSPGAAS